MSIVVVPHDQLQPEILRAFIEEFITRSGAVHGHTEMPLCERIEAVYRQLRSGKAVIVFDEESGSSTIILKDDLRRGRQAGGSKE